MSAFGITPASTAIPLDEAGQGVGSFTVSNETNHPIRVSTSVTATGVPPPPKEWLVGPEHPERDLAVDGSDQFTVQVSVPAGSAGGTFGFRLDAVSVELPDEEWAHGPEVTFVVPEPPLPPPPPDEPPPPPVKKGYVETAAGALLGGFGGGIGGGLIATLMLVVVGHVPLGGDFGTALGTVIGLLILAVLLTLVALWVGVPLGAYLFLKSQGFVEPFRTAIPIAFFFPVWSVLLVIVAGNLKLDLPGPVALVLTLVGLALAIVVPALAGRALYRFRTTGGL